MLNRKPDVEVTFSFLGVRLTPSANGYRPHHDIAEDVSICGSHHYYGDEIAPVLGTIDGTITFLMPEAYGAVFHIGQRVNIMEGSRIVGYAIINRVLNPMLEPKDK